MGLDGWRVMDATVRYIGSEHFTIADAKRGDIGNTAEQYARAFFEQMPFHSITVAPYMGEDSVKPFLKTEGKWAIVLGLTSNAGAADFELQKLAGTDRFLYEEVMEKTAGWGSPNNLMFVVGATQAAQFANIRKITPEHFYLVPGVGAQGGSLRDISQIAMIKDAGLLVNASRAIQYASSGPDFLLKKQPKWREITRPKCRRICPPQEGESLNFGRLFNVLLILKFDTNGSPHGPVYQPGLFSVR
ncbi:MAG: orotidine-5'-phosphate decarboxylase [Chitinophagaceae bacterium]|nr:orotidine-5'-phosphate decarboxylase [Chitinophagaceae bacterium]